MEEYRGVQSQPGNCILHRLFPLTLTERPPMNFERFKNLPRIIPLSARASGSTFPAADIEERMTYGELPGVALLNETDRRSILRSFSTVHLEGEIRGESLVKEREAQEMPEKNGGRGRMTAAKNVL